MIDDARKLPDGHTLAADICVVGAGAAGITLALELAGTPQRVLLLESGGLKAEKPTQRLYQGSVADERLHSPPHRYRQRRFGGTTTIWGGRCVPFDAIDFAMRDYVPLSGWPFGLDTLLPFYPRANELCEAGNFRYRASEIGVQPLRPMIEGFRSEHFSTDTLERFSCPTDFGSRYGGLLRAASNVTVLLHANLTAIRLHANSEAVDTLEVRTLGGKRCTVRAPLVVLATGALEVARLLLANRTGLGHGIGNRYDNVGRHYMCHLAGTAGTFTSAAGAAHVWHGYDVSDDGIYCRRRFALNAATQRQLALGNFIARLHHPRITDPAHRTAVLSALQLAKGFISYEYGKRLGERGAGMRDWFAHVRNVMSAPHEVLAFVHHMVRDHFLAKRRFPSIIVRSKTGTFSLDFHAEQQPNPLSRITLTGEHDALGMPRLRVDWRYTDADVRTVQEALRLFAEDVRACGAGTFEYDPRGIEMEIARYGAYGGHHLGTARIGSDPHVSVVDTNCRMHDVRNLYVAGGAVFATSGQANPTLTIVALAARLAARLKSLCNTARPIALRSIDAGS
jgi:choline dehydrogenase-like flavoprotein